MIGRMDTCRIFTRTPWPLVAAGGSLGCFVATPDKPRHSMRALCARKPRLAARGEWNDRTNQITCASSRARLRPLIPQEDRQVVSRLDVTWVQLQHLAQGPLRVVSVLALLKQGATN